MLGQLVPNGKHGGSDITVLTLLGRAPMLCSLLYYEALWSNYRSHSKENTTRFNYTQRSSRTGPDRASADRDDTHTF